jgi:hypothetical protein
MVACERHDHERARSLSTESLAAFRRFGVTWGIAECLQQLGTVDSQEERFARATRLIAAAERVRQIIGFQLPPIDRVRSDQLVARLRAVLSEDDFTSAWADGLALTLEQAVAYAQGAAAPAQNEASRSSV